MAELKDEEFKRLASDFLTTKAGENEIAVLNMAIENNAEAALELLAQVQAAREGVRTGLSAEQNEGVRPRVEALIAAHARKRGIFGLFRRRPKPVPAPEPVPGPASAPAPASASALGPAGAPVPAPAPAGAPGTTQATAAQPPFAARDAEPDADMEDTAPIAEIVDAASVTPRLGAPGSALAAMQAAPPAPAVPAASSARLAPAAQGVEKPAPQTPVAEKPAVQKPMMIPAAVNFGAVPEVPKRTAPVKAPPRSRKGLVALLVLAVLLAVAYTYRTKLVGLYAPPAPPVAHHVPMAPPAAAMQGPAVRADAAAPALDAPLPAQLPKP